MKETAINRNVLRIGAVLCLVAMWVVLPFALGDKTVSADELSETRIGATLTGAPIGGVTPAGFSEFRLDDQGRRRLRVEGSSINLAQGTSLQIVVNNAAVGNTSVSGFGTIFFDIDSGNGQNVPVINVGNPIQVLNGGTVVLSGTFGTVTPTPSPSGSPTASPTGTPTGSPSPTATPTGSPSPTATPTGSPSPSPSPTGTPNAGNLFASLSGATINGVLPNGFAEFEIHSSRLELEIRVNQVNLPAGTVLGVTVDNAAVGNLFLEGGGEGRLRLRTDRGQTVPPVVSGSTIVIRNGGTTILSGIFRPFTGPSPSPTPTGSPSPTPSPSPSPGRSFEADLTGTAGANGEIKVTLDAAGSQATIFGEFHNLGSSQTGARIETTVGDGSVVIDFGVIGGTNGAFTRVTIPVNAAQSAMLRSGLWSAVVTSVNSPSGAIRGILRPRSNPSDFDGDGINDLAVFRPSAGAWYSQNSEGFGAQIFGNAGDKVVSGDYDGDGRTDAAVFKNSGGQGVWEIRRSSDNGTTVEQFGLATDIAARGDYDGDGRGDLAVFRPSNGVWYVKNSRHGSIDIVQFGIAEDQPIPADFDGDGRDDIAVFRPSTGSWYWLRSSDGGFASLHWGQTGDVPVRGDFDSDGKSDVTVFRPSNGVWYTLRSSDSGFVGMAFGLDGDVPVAGNYDSDGKTDIAVFRPSSGYWYILRSTDGAAQAAPFGINGDIPAIAR